MRRPARLPTTRSPADRLAASRPSSAGRRCWSCCSSSRRSCTGSRRLAGVLHVEHHVLRRAQHGRGRDHGAAARADRDHRRDRPLGRVHARPLGRRDGGGVHARLVDLAGDGRRTRCRGPVRGVQRFPHHAAWAYRRSQSRSARSRSSEASPRGSCRPTRSRSSRSPSRTSACSRSKEPRSRGRSRSLRPRGRVRRRRCTRRPSDARSSPSARGRRRRSSPASGSSESSSGSSCSRVCLSGFAGILWTLRFASARYDSGVGLELLRRHDRASRGHLDLRRTRDDRRRRARRRRSSGASRRR